MTDKGFDFDVEKATDTLSSLQRLCGLDATLFSPILEASDTSSINVHYTTYGCQQSCPRASHLPEGQIWGKQCRKCHLSAGMLADRHGGYYVYICPERKLFIASAVLTARSLSAIMTIGPAEVVEEDEEPVSYKGYEPFKQRNSETFHDITLMLAAAGDYVSDREESYLRKVGKMDNSARSNMSNSIISNSKYSKVYEYPIVSENALTEALKAGDPISALAALDKLYAFTLSHGTTIDERINFDLLTDLVVIISRAGLEAGVDSSVIFTASDRCKRELRYVSTKLQIYHRLRFLVEEITGYVQSIRNIKYERGIYRTQTYVYTHYRESLSLEAIADEVGYSPAYLSRVFKEKTGMNLVAFINKVRIEAAMSELRTTDYNVSEVAQRCGFDSLGYFTRVFKKHTGVTPGQYRLHGSASENETPEREASE